MKNILLILLALIFFSGCTSAQEKPKEYLVSHVMCATEEEAIQALKKIRAGETFEKVAAEVSMDPGTKNKGGKITFWMPANSWSKNFANEVNRLNVGEISSSPVHTEFGWHIVRVDAIR